MRTFLLASCGAGLLGLAGCGGAASYVHSDTTTLGRVVVYRNGVAYFERYAKVDDDKLTLAVPPDKVDDFLKSLNVVDARTGEPTPVSYPTDTNAASATPGASGLIDMQIKLPGNRPHELRLSYVTEAPAWKPSYRVVLRDDKSVDLVGWAIVDNTSGEDWKNVRLGVGASSALSFRFDLRSVRLVERETLESSDLFAQAPPMGQATYGGPPVVMKKILGDLGEDAIPDEATAEADSAHVKADDRRGAPPSPPASGAGLSGLTEYEGSGRGSAVPAAAPSAAAQASPPRMVRPSALDAIAHRVKSESGPILVEGYAAPGDADKQAASLERANRVREKLVRDGVDPGRVLAVGKGEEAGHAAGARIVEGPAAQAAKTTPAAPAAPDAVADPIGTSHFESTSAMTVPRGTSAMVSILHTPTEGQVVYLYDPESPRGNAQFAFKSLRIRNPTDSQLESGPVSVFGEGRFIGEGLSEPIPGKQIAFVPFALDRQVVVDRTDAERDEIARVLTVQRGVFSTQVQHIKKTTLVVHNRLAAPAIVYVRHAVATGYHLVKGPSDPEHVGNADLYRVEVEGYGKKEIALEEATPVYRTADIRSPDGLELVKAYLSSAALEGPLKGQVDDLVKMQQEIGNVEQRIATLHDQMTEYRQRMDELHAQIVTLRMVRTGGPLMASLEKKLQEMSDKLSKGTIDVVGLEEKRMLARIKFEDGVADLTLEKAPEMKADDKKDPTSVAGKSG